MVSGGSERDHFSISVFNIPFPFGGSTNHWLSERWPARAVMSDRSKSAQLLLTNVCSTLLQNLPISARLMDLRPLAGVWCSGARTQQSGPDTSQTLWETHMESVKNQQNKYCNILSGTVSYCNNSAKNWTKSCTPGNQTHTGPQFWCRVWMLMFLKYVHMETV